MTIYRNKNWTARNYDCTNVRFQITDEQPRNLSNGQVDLDNWEPLNEAEHDEADMCAELGIEYLASEYGVEPLGGFVAHRFWGHL